VSVFAVVGLMWLCAAVAWGRTGRRLGTLDELAAVGGAVGGFGLWVLMAVAGV
jgi:hypothetical protein